jgi:hypothetical protein
LIPVIPWRVVVSDETPVVTFPVAVSVTVVSMVLVVSVLSAPAELDVSVGDVVVSDGLVRAPVEVVVSYIPCSLVTGMRCCETAVVVSVAEVGVDCASTVAAAPKANAAAAPIDKNFAECRRIIWSSRESRP